MSLSLLILDGDFPETKAQKAWAYSHSMLDVQLLPESVRAIESIAQDVGKPLPENFTSYLRRLRNGECGYGDGPWEDAFGKRIVCVPAIAVGAAIRQWKNNPFAHAVGDFLSALPDDARVALYWH